MRNKPFQHKSEKKQSAYKTALACLYLGLSLPWALDPTPVLAQSETSSQTNTPAKPDKEAAGTDKADKQLSEAEQKANRALQARLKARKDQEQTLKNLRASIKLSKERETQLSEEIARLENDRKTIKSDLIETADRIKQLEASLSKQEANLKTLFEDETALRVSLAEQRDSLSEILAALQRIGRNPPPALAIKPNEALDAVRSAILLSTLVPEIRIEAQALASQLTQLLTLRENIQKESKALQASLSSLGEERQRLDLLMAKKREEQEKSRKAAQQEKQKTTDLAQQATSLEDLIASMEKEIEAARLAVQDAKDAEKKAIQQKIETKKQKIAALKDAARLSPAIPFAKMKGLVRLPVQGSLVKDFGVSDGFGNATKGLSIATRAGAQVTSPTDGWVVFARPFRSYGQLIFIDAGDGYLILLAGLESLSVDVGSFVLANEPIGQMRKTRLADTDLLDVSSRPVLYLELRKSGVAINPSPWWTTPLNEKADG